MPLQLRLEWKTRAQRALPENHSTRGDVSGASQVVKSRGGQGRGEQGT